MSTKSDPFKLENKVAIITGAARGIGAAIAESLAERGANVLITDVDEQAAKDTAQRLNDKGLKAFSKTHNVTIESEWAAVIAYAEKNIGPIDILVNNAGIETASLIANCEVQDFEKVMNVNVTGVFLGIKYAVKAMQPGGTSGKGGNIVNLSSVAGIIGTSGHIAYHASKGAVRTMTKAAAIECAQLGTQIRVNSIHPAIVQTQMGTSFIQDFVDLKLVPDYATAEAAIKAAHPMGKFGEPSDVANAVIYLASDAAKWVTGTELVLDGGYTAA